MTSRRTIWFAFATGMGVEATLCGLFAMFGRFGPCGAANDITGLLFVLHIPGIATAAAFPEALQLPVIIFVSTALWGVAAFVVITAVWIIRDMFKKRKAERIAEP